ncbi:MAG: helix-turn-helix transcriptional regulator [Paludibacter sp.]|nr:helix-turn-helix transcriptional regulator [Paludibacter sp.]
MLQLNLAAVIKARGIQKPTAYLVNMGFSHDLATRLANNKVGTLRLSQIEKLCYHLNCSPNDLLTWTPGKNQVVADNHPLQKLRRTNDPDSMQLLKEMPYDELLALSRKIQEEKETNAE